MGNFPSDQKQILCCGVRAEFAFDLGDQLFPVFVDFILCLEQGAPLIVPLGLNGFDLLLAGEFFLKGQGGGRGAASFFDHTVEFLDLAFETGL